MSTQNWVIILKTGSRIRIEREAQGISRDELASRCSMSVRTLEKIEQGAIEEPKLIDVAAIAQAMGKTCADFLPDDQPEPPPTPRGRPIRTEPESTPPILPPATPKKGKKS